MTRKEPSLAETIVALYFALEMRERCEICRGTGVVYFDHQGEAEPEPCFCSEQAHHNLEYYRERFEAMLPLYVMEGGDKDWLKKRDKHREMAKEMLKEKRD